MASPRSKVFVQKVTNPPDCVSVEGAGFVDLLPDGLGPRDPNGEVPVRLVGDDARSGGASKFKLQLRRDYDSRD
jgi:hypothetical protein